MISYSSFLLVLLIAAIVTAIVATFSSIICFTQFFKSIAKWFKKLSKSKKS